MASYLLIYHMDNPAAVEDREAHMAAYQKWLADLGDAVEVANQPLGKSICVGADGVIEGGVTQPIMGFTQVRAENEEAAIAMAQANPFLDMGRLEVRGMLSMPGG